ncbi:MAG: type I-E CRISPR-associated protein Cas6/Cse3/CasE [Sphaerochaeta sp.]|nr:type I-E CRISPR-associated protein Cas6/Cse3/CasE [Sphaerochaeta sp.]
MIISKLFLDVHALKHYGLKDDGYSLHVLIYSLFPGNERDFLYYDYGMGNSGRTILIKSHSSPLVPEVGSLESKRVAPEFYSHDRYGFQVLVNPVIKRKGNSSLVPVRGDKAIREWIFDRQESWGFSVDWNSLELEEKSVLVIPKGENRLVFNRYLLRGSLFVLDRANFLESCERGIGRGKAFGFGMLQIRPLL